VWVILGICLLFFVLKKKTLSNLQSSSLPAATKKIMLVVAHPDDESMFFVPFLASAYTQKKHLYLLCLSKGIEPGTTRIEEVTEASKRLHFKQLVVHEFEVSNGNSSLGREIKDGFDQDWPASTVAQIVEHYRDKWGIDTIVTFDSEGISGHPNHKQTHRGVVHHSNTTGGELKLHYFFLHTTPWYLKYLSWIPLCYSNADPNSLLYKNSDSNLVWEVMKIHHSQLVWFRKFYLLFSSYVYLNRLTGGQKK